MNPATATEPHRDLSASFNERTTGSRVEFAQWREAHPDFTSQELLDAWASIRRAWGLSRPEPKQARK